MLGFFTLWDMDKISWNKVLLHIKFQSYWIRFNSKWLWFDESFKFSLLFFSFDKAIVEKLRETNFTKYLQQMQRRVFIWRIFLHFIHHDIQYFVKPLLIICDLTKKALIPLRNFTFSKTFEQIFRENTISTIYMLHYIVNWFDKIILLPLCEIKQGDFYFQFLLLLFFFFFGKIETNRVKLR